MPLPELRESGGGQEHPRQGDREHRADEEHLEAIRALGIADRQTRTGTHLPMMARRAPTLGHVPIDLHAHSTASDGTLTPAEVMAAAARAGLDVVAITDHDTTPAGPPPGARPRAGRGPGARGRAVLLAPGRQRAPARLPLRPDGRRRWSRELDRVRRPEGARVERIVELLRADGIRVTWDEVRDYAAGGTRRPAAHRAGADPAAGWSRTSDEAFADVLGRQPLPVPHDALDRLRGVRLVRGRGRRAGVRAPARQRAGRGPSTTR